MRSAKYTHHCLIWRVSLGGEPGYRFEESYAVDGSSLANFMRILAKKVFGMSSKRWLAPEDILYSCKSNWFLEYLRSSSATSIVHPEPIYEPTKPETDSPANFRLIITVRNGLKTYRKSRKRLLIENKRIKDQVFQSQKRTDACG